MMDISYLSADRQKYLFWALGMLMYLPLMVKLLIVIMGENRLNMPLTTADVDLLLVIFLIIASLGSIIYLFYLVAGPFLAARRSLVMGRPRRLTRDWHGSSSRKSTPRIIRRPATQSGTVDVIKPSEVSKTPLVAHCEFCDAKAYMPYQCKRCNGVFCDDHRLPEKHRCPYV